MCKFRDLKADEIESRIQSVKWDANHPNKCGIVLLLYKDARVDMNILDETVGSSNWQNKFYEHKGILFCSLGINTNFNRPTEPDRWVWKDDAGVESNTEAEKGNASDARKRSGTCWGIGRELYTSPFIWIPSDKCDIKDVNGKKQCYDKFVVEKINIKDKKIVGLVIRNTTKNCIAFSWGDCAVKEATPEEPTYICADCKAVVNPEMAKRTEKAFGVVLCKDCGLKRSKVNANNG